MDYELTPEEQQRKAVQEALMAKFQAAGSDNSAIEQANADAKRQRLIAGIGEALSGAATAESRSRGGQASDPSMFRNMSSDAGELVKQAILAKQRQGQDLAQQMQMNSQAGQESRDILKSKMGQKDLESELTRREAQTGKESEAAKLARDRLSEDSRHNKSTEEIARENKQAQMDARQAALDMKQAQMEAKQASAETKQSPFEKTQDTEAAKVLTEFRSGGGKASIDTAVNSLEKIAKKLETSDMTGGIGQRFLSAVPGGEHIRKATSPDITATMQEIQAAVLPGLKAMFPGAISNAEAERFVALSFDPSLSGKENARKLRAQVATFQDRASVLSAMDKQARETGSVAGFKPEFTPKRVMNDKGQTATVRTPEEEAEAAAEGFK